MLHFVLRSVKADRWLPPPPATTWMVPFTMPEKCDVSELTQIFCIDTNRTIYKRVHQMPVLNQYIFTLGYKNNFNMRNDYTKASVTVSGDIGENIFAIKLWIMAID